MVISAPVDLHFRFCAAGGRSIEKFFARRRRIPDILGADQDQNRDGARPCRLLLVVARCRVEGDCSPEVTLRQLGGPGAALRGDRKKHRAATLRPADHPDAIRPDKGLGLHKQQRAIDVVWPLSIKFLVAGLWRACLALVARPKTVDHQHDVAAAAPSQSNNAPTMRSGANCDIGLAHRALRRHQKYGCRK